MCFGTALLGTVCVAPRAALAQGATVAGEEGARAAFAEGLRLRDEMRRPTEAVPKFAEAYKLAKTPITAFEYAKTLMAIGNLVEAQRIFASINEMPPDPLQSARGKTARDEAKRLATELDSKIPSIAVKLQNVPVEHATPRVSIDDKPIELSAIGKPQKVNPGEHKVVVVSGDGQEHTKAVTILEGKTEPVTFDLKPGVKISLADRRTVAVIVGGAGAVGVGVSLLLGISANSLDSSARKVHCGAAVGGHSDTQCDYQGMQNMRTAGSRADLATVLFIVGGAALGAGAILWLTAPPPNKEGATHNIGFGIGPGGVVARGGF
jgi:hypothetical protein